MAYHNNRVVALFERLWQSVGKKHVAYYQSYIDRVSRYLEADKQTRATERRLPRISDAPISQTLGPEDPDIPLKTIWHEHYVSIVEEPKTRREQLRIQAKTGFVTSVKWRQAGHQAEVTL
jgi:hypothetical protein